MFSKLWFLLWGEANSSNYIHDNFHSDKYNWSYIIRNEYKLFLADCEPMGEMASPSLSVNSIFMITKLGVDILTMAYRLIDW